MIFSYDFSEQKHVKETCWRFTTAQFSTFISVRWKLRNDMLFMSRKDVPSPCFAFKWSWTLLIVCTSEGHRIPYLRRLWTTMPRTRYYIILNYCLRPYFSKLPSCKSRLFTAGYLYQLNYEIDFFVSNTISTSLQHQSCGCQRSIFMQSFVFERLFVF